MATREQLYVGIGASAGGLEALKTFFSSFTEKTGISFIVIIHLSPDHKSSMDKLLQAQTPLEVVQVNEKTEIKPDYVYVIPPSKILIVGDNHLELSEPEGEGNHPSHAIDQFYRSLGTSKGKNAVSITLSGTGSDGATGMKTIKEKGGLTIVQNPAEAAYSGMPQSAIDTGLADKVLSVKEMSRELLKHRKSLSAVHISDNPDKLSDDQQDVLSKILVKVRKETDHDFTNYKRSTMIRRVKRRMHVHNVATLDEYLAVLNKNDGEAQELFKDLLISVTNFFRNSDVFEVLEKKAIPQLFKDRNADDDLRVWVPGCATGEEAYSIAILLYEHARNVDHPPQIQIFATDIDEQALQVARKGKYPDSIAGDISKHRLKYFFKKAGHEYVVNEKIRDMILFSKHDLLRNPPFSKQDMISCRNLLIYLDKELQNEVFNLFHYALKVDGLLFLGNSDPNLKATDRFKPLNKQHKIYRRRTTSQLKGRLPDLPLQYRENQTSLPSLKSASQKDNNLQQLHQRLITRHYGPPSIIINESEKVLHSTAGIRQYFNYTEGEPSQNILKMVIPKLRQPLRSILYQAKKNKTDLPVSKDVELHRGGTLQEIKITLHKIEEKDSSSDLMYIVFQEMGTAQKDIDHQRKKRKNDVDDNKAEIIDELEHELKETKEHLQITVEDYETSNEELRSSNEELQSMNEELQSTTEELETSQEELQSVNQEIESVNQELESKIEELQHANDDLKNLMEATEIAIIFIDRDLQLKRFTSKATEIFSLQPSDEGRSLRHFTHQLTYDAVIDDAENVLANLEKKQKEVSDKNGKAYIMRMVPYHTTKGEINGVVITFMEITELKAAKKELTDKIEQIKELQRQIIRTNVNERWKVGQYLHDEVAQSLLAARLSLERINRKLKNMEDTSDITGEISDIAKLIKQNLVDVRDLSHRILPVDIEREGIKSAFSDLAEQAEKMYSINCQFKDKDAVNRVDDIEVGTNLYRITREAIKNAVTHGGAENIRITFYLNAHVLHMDIEDDGKGFEASESDEKGMGINIMQHRMELMGGTMEIGESSHFENKGTLITCKLPLDKMK